MWEAPRSIWRLPRNSATGSIKTSRRERCGRTGPSPRRPVVSPSRTIGTPPANPRRMAKSIIRLRAKASAALAVAASPAARRARERGRPRRRRRTRGRRPRARRESRRDRAPPSQRSNPTHQTSSTAEAPQRPRQRGADAWRAEEPAAATQDPAQPDEVHVRRERGRQREARVRAAATSARARRSRWPRPIRSRRRRACAHRRGRRTSGRRSGLPRTRADRPRTRRAPGR